MINKIIIMMLKFILRIVEILIVLEVFAFALVFWMNDKDSSAINLRMCLGYLSMSFIGLAIIGIIINELLKPKK